MNPLTQIKNTQKATQREIAAGFSESASWHAKFKHSAYIFAGGLAYTLTEGDLLAVFSQYGEIVDVNLVRDKETAKSRGFAFLAYEDQRSTVLAVDNLSGSRVAGRIIRVDHVDNYKVKRAEVEGRPVSDSDDDEGMDAAEVADAEAAARMEGATVERIDTGRAAGPSGAPAAGGDAPWAGGSSVFALLQQEVPKPQYAGGGALTDALAAPSGGVKKEKKEKKEKRKHEDGKEKKSKKEKKRKAEGGPGDAADDRAAMASRPEDAGEPDVRRHAEGRSAARPDDGGMREPDGSRHREREEDRRRRHEGDTRDERHRDRDSERRGGGGPDRGYRDRRGDGRE